MWGTGPVRATEEQRDDHADMVITFMNSARKNRAKRIEGVLGVEPADQLGLASVRSNGGRVSSAVVR